MVTETVTQRVPYCETHREEYTVNRRVAHCVAKQVPYTLTRCVPRCVEKQIPYEQCYYVPQTVCSNGCATGCDAPTRATSPAPADNSASDRTDTEKDPVHYSTEMPINPKDHPAPEGEPSKDEEPTPKPNT
jgi:hypothetical protein